MKENERRNKSAFIVTHTYILPTTIECWQCPFQDENRDGGVGCNPLCSLFGGSIFNSKECDEAKRNGFAEFKHVMKPTKYKKDWE